MITRKEYMQNSKKLFHAYYLEIAKEAGIDYSESDLLPRVKEALKAGDEHLNTIPLSIWDANGMYTQRTINTAMKKRGDFWSLAGSVCVHKTAAKEAAKKK